MAAFVSRSKVEFELCGGNLPEKYKAFVRRVLNDKNLIPSADVAPVTSGDRVMSADFISAALNVIGSCLLTEVTAPTAGSA